MKDVNGIQTPYDTCIVPVPGTGGGVGVKDVSGVSVEGGQKGTTGQMPEVSGVSLPNDDAPGTKRPDIAGS